MEKNKHNVVSGSKVERSNDRIKVTGEVFTPLDLCRIMVDEIPGELLKDPRSKFLDNSAGNGNFLVTLLEKLSSYHDKQYILDNMLYAVELMSDNHAELCNRLGVDISHPHYVCADALSYDYQFNG